MLRIRLQKLIAFSLLQLTALICFLDIRTCEGLQPPSPAKKIVSKLTGNTGSGRSKGSSVPSMGSAFLESLKLDSNTEPKTFGFLPSQILGLATASFPLVMRLGSGVFACGYQISLAPRDESRYTILSLGSVGQIRETSDIVSSKQNEPIILYEFEGCPFCRKVREAVSMLSLEVTFRPCPQGGAFRKEIKNEYGAKATFPYLVDPNTGVKMFESDDIIAYLFRVYGNSKKNDKVPWTLSPPGSPLVTLSSGLAMLPRINRGNRYRASNIPEQPLIFWSYEGSPFTKLVRERLVELGLPHTQISCPRGSVNRQRLFQKTGCKFFQVPFLEDPNTGVELFESAAIIEYLEKVYSVPEPRVKYI